MLSAREVSGSSGVRNHRPRRAVRADGRGGYGDHHGHGRLSHRPWRGNVATRDPWESDPRYADITSGPGNTKGPTTKKLWVAAIDMPPTPGTDPSHPAFYLPAQELFAGNSRAFWVPDACREVSEQCEGGDECCGGYCRANAEGVPVCMDELPPESCAMEYENCRSRPAPTARSGRRGAARATTWIPRPGAISRSGRTSPSSSAT